MAEVKKENPWYYQVSKCAPQQALRNLEQGIKRWRQGLGRFPVFKKKGKRDSFYLEGAIRISGNRIKVPVLGWLKCHEQLPATSPKNVTISHQADRWYIAFKFEAPEPKQPEKEGDVVGLDLGINNLATCSNGKTFPNPKAYRKAKRRLVRLQRNVSRRQKGSRNRKQAVRAVAKLHKRIVDIRKDNLHKLTTYLAKKYRVVVIEDLFASAGRSPYVSGMVKNPKLAGSIADCGFYELRRQLEYKCKLYGCQLVLADRFYPSSQLCSRCGHQQKMPLHQRVFCCERCGLEIDRDLNAAINLVKWYQTTLSSRGSYACGDSSAGVGSPTRYESWKQEESSNLNESPLLFSVV